MKKMIRATALLLLLAAVFTGCSLFPPVPGGDTVSTPPDGSIQSQEQTKPLKELFHYNGRFETDPTDDDDKLSFWLLWDAVSYDGLTAQISIKVGITCHNINISKSTGSVTLNTKQKSFSSPAILNRQNKQTRYWFNRDNSIVFTVDLTQAKANEYDISAIWDCGDDSFLIDGVIVLPPDADVTVSGTGERIGEPTPQVDPAV